MRQRPGHIFQREPPALPVRDRVFGAQAIEIDRDIHIRFPEFDDEAREMLTPVRAQNRAAPILIRHRAIVRPRMDFEPPFPFRAPIPKKLAGPPAFKVAATPDAHLSRVRQFERAIDPASAPPARRADIPIGMVVERNEDEWIDEPPCPERAQVVKIAGTVNQERRNPRFLFAVKFFDQPCRRREAQAWSPRGHIERLARERTAGPGIIQIEMNRLGQVSNVAADRTKATAHFVSDARRPDSKREGKVHGKERQREKEERAIFVS